MVFSYPLSLFFSYLSNSSTLRKLLQIRCPFPPLMHWVLAPHCSPSCLVTSLWVHACPVMLSFLPSFYIISFSSFFCILFPFSLISPTPSVFPCLLSLTLLSFYFPFQPNLGDTEPTGRQTGNMQGTLGTLRTLDALRVKGPVLCWLSLAITISRSQDWRGIYILCTFSPRSSPY